MNDPDQLSLLEEASPEEASPFAIEVPVLKVFDGDGFLTKITHPRHHTEKEALIRCGFIDAPELEQRGGCEARQFLTALMWAKSLA
jgi:endonuclease YncB( thermonuclease family)